MKVGESKSFSCRSVSVCLCRSSDCFPPAPSVQMALWMLEKALERKV